MAQTTEKVEKVIFAEETATVHVIDGDVTEENGQIVEPIYSKVLLPGETIGLSEVPSYLRKLVEEGKAPGLTLLTPAQAKRLVNKAQRTKASISDLADNAADDE
jgi:hypothetical protein